MIRRRCAARFACAVAASTIILIWPASRAVGAQATNFAQPESHFRVEQPADLGPEDAAEIYGRILDDMVEAYAMSRDPSASAYRRWPRFNRGPYRSDTHGDRFVNHYGNAIAEADYARFGGVAKLPVGSILAKDSFAVTADGEVFSGPLFLMEKMPAGFNPESRDWRYSMILPDGSFFGATNGDSSERVQFCITCHELAGDENDHLFFVPDDYRAVAEE